MNAFDEFIMSDAFFPVIVVLLILLIAVFVIITVNNRRKYGPVKNLKNVPSNKIDYNNEVRIVNTDSLSKIDEVNENEINDLISSIKQNETLSNIEPEKEIIQSVEEPQEKIGTFEEVFPNEVSLPKVEEIAQNMEVKPETNIGFGELERNQEVFPSEVSLPKTEKIAQKVEIKPETGIGFGELEKNQEVLSSEVSLSNTQENNISTQDISLEKPQMSVDTLPKENDVQGEENFDTKPSSFMSDVQDFPDFSSIENKEPHENSKIEDDILEAANKYIESIMSNK